VHTKCIDEVHEEAALILAICASIDPRTIDRLGGSTYGSVCNGVEASDAAMTIAGRAWSKAVLSTTYDVVDERHLVYAEAEALVRTGAV
jgi:hypothetical protein